jgi:hypothetical protein
LRVTVVDVANELTSNARSNGTGAVVLDAAASGLSFLFLMSAKSARSIAFGAIAKR